MRWLGVDYGTKRIGVAVGDEETLLVTPLEAIQCSGANVAARRLGDLADEYGADGIVVGWPLNMDGSEGDQAKLTRTFAAAVAAATDLDVRLWDERLSSAAADDKLARTFTRKKKKARHDAVAAGVILQDFLSGDGPCRAARPDDEVDTDQK